jgi:threonyl-tRNA synthetase
MAKNEIEVVRHSLAHLMAAAVKSFYPEVKFGMGPAIENGFYYDFDLGENKLAPENLKEIEVKMKKLIGGGFKFERKEVGVREAKTLFGGQFYKFEILDDLEAKGEKIVSLYQSGDFIDLCRGPHVDAAKDLPVDGFKLTKIAGAYWKGGEKNPMLTRIYCVAFSSKKELDEYLKQQEEAEKRDHRKLGKELDLFVFSDLVGKGLPLFTEKGATIRREMERFIIDEEIKRGYRHICTPELAKVDLYRVSGHYPYYKDTMYPVMKVDEEELILRPMSCPHHFQYYASRPRSYKELPFRIAESAKLYRYEKSGELSGLMRVRQFCLADGHIISQKEMAEKEIDGALDLIEFCTNALGLKITRDYRYRLSLGDRNDEKKYYKDDNSWDYAEGVLREVLKKRQAEFFEAPNEAAFYGPKIDIQMKNLYGKEETAFTVQYDFVMPKRFELSYIDKDGIKQEPVVIHRSSIGALERIIAFLIEHYAGAFPVWLSPVQVKILSVGESHIEFCQKLGDELKLAGIRCEIDAADETLGNKIRKSAGEKIPYVLVIGDKEMAAASAKSSGEPMGDMLAVRDRGSKTARQISKPDFIAEVCAKIKNRN